MPARFLSGLCLPFFPLDSYCRNINICIRLLKFYTVSPSPQPPFIVLFVQPCQYLYSPPSLCNKHLYLWLPPEGDAAGLVLLVLSPFKELLSTLKVHAPFRFLRLYTQMWMKIRVSGKYFKSVIPLYHEIKLSKARILRNKGSPG